MIFGDISMSEEQTRRKEIEEIVKAAIEKQEDRKALAYAFYKFIKIGMCHASNKSLTNQEVEKYLEHYEKEMLYILSLLCDDKSVSIPKITDESFLDRWKLLDIE